MEEIERGLITIEGGLDGDHKGPKFPLRRITVLAVEDWQKALSELSEASLPPAIPWTARRANLLIEGLRLPRARGARIAVGPVVLEVTYPTQPCARMNEAHPGLLKALHAEWRGGVTCRVIEGGAVRIGDPVGLAFSPPERQPRLPG
jgi:MOSC domain-containing protein YiiM